MATQKKLNIGLFGFGVVGEGIYNVLQDTPSLNAEIKRICIKHLDKKRNAPAALFTDKSKLLLNDPDINVIVELIDDADAAYDIVKKAFANGKSVVSANKKLIAEHLSELIARQHLAQVSFLYEAAVCGSIPLIRNLEEYYDNDLLNSFSGIVNGSTNFILTKMKQENLSFSQSLQLAQQLGFAESNPALDVEGKDAANKLCIIIKHAYGITILPNEIVHKGINYLNEQDMRYAGEKGYAVKLVAGAKCTGKGKISAFVLPTFVNKKSQLYNVHNEYNGVLLGSKLADEQFLYGKGAGRYPTSSAVLSDISALSYQYRYEYKKSISGERYRLSEDEVLNIYVSYNTDIEIIEYDFLEINERYIGKDRNYLVGKIALTKLKNALWFYNAGVSVIVFQEKSKEVEETFISIEKQEKYTMTNID